MNKILPWLRRVDRAALLRFLQSKDLLPKHEAASDADMDEALARYHFGVLHNGNGEADAGAEEMSILQRACPSLKVCYALSAGGGRFLLLGSDGTPVNEERTASSILAEESPIAAAWQALTAQPKRAAAECALPSPRAAHPDGPTD